MFTYIYIYVNMYILFSFFFMLSLFEQCLVYLRLTPLLILLLLTYCIGSKKDGLSRSILSCHIKSLQSISTQASLHLMSYPQLTRILLLSLCALCQANTLTPYTLCIYSVCSSPMCCRSHHPLIYSIAIRHAIAVLINWEYPYICSKWPCASLDEIPCWI